MAYTTIDDPTIFFNTLLYTGNTTQRSITGVGFQPDWVWFKNRSASQPHCLVDAVRGVNNSLASNNNNSVDTDANDLQAFQSDGFQIGTNNRVNGNGNSMVAWNWKAGGSASSNSNGSITTSVSANTTAGFSIVSYTGTFANATVGHGLGVAPKVIILKNRDSSNNWCVGHGSSGFDKFLALNETDAAGTDSTYRFQGTSPTSTVYSVGAGGETNGPSQDMIAYCFAEKKGYSKFGIYEGASSADGSYIYLGFKPALFLAKAIGRSENWYLFDNKRLGYNVDNNQIYHDTSGTEGTTDWIDFLSNGVKYRYNSVGLNGAGEQYIYMAFAESPFVNSNGVPTNAR